ncbi:hypothetical protein POUND7_000739 [Theobroma cacao]
MEGEEINKTEEEKIYCLCRLPVDVLEIILRYLSVLDYIKFRTVSKCWRLAFSTCASSSSIILQQRPEREFPWFVVLKTKPEGRKHRGCPVLHTEGLLGNMRSRVAYKTDMPELCGTRILLSKYGWLLLFKGNDNSCSSSSLYFFNPFSKAKIVLPSMDVTKLRSPLFDISAPPTSPDCMVFIAYWVQWKRVMIDLCRKGESNWTSYGGGPGGPIINAVFAKGIWYYLHSDGELSAFDAVHHHYICTPGILGLDFSFYTFSRLVSYAVKRGEQVLLRIHACCGCYEIALSSPHLLVATTINRGPEDPEYLFLTDAEKAMEREREVICVDSFNPDAWCLVYPSADTFECRWHQFISNRIPHYDLREISCHVRNKCSTFFMWFEPVWVEPSPNLTWT